MSTVKTDYGWQALRYSARGRVAWSEGPLRPVDAKTAGMLTSKYCLAFVEQVLHMALLVLCRHTL